MTTVVAVTLLALAWFGLRALVRVAQGAARAACLRWAQEQSAADAAYQRTRDAWLARRRREDHTERGLSRLVEDMRRVEAALPSDAPNPWIRRPGERMHPSPSRYATIEELVGRTVEER